MHRIGALNRLLGSPAVGGDEESSRMRGDVIVATLVIAEASSFDNAR
jgi:hypothetical protein